MIWQTDSQRIFVTERQRDGGETSENQWKDVQKVLRVQRGRLDRDYLEKWARTLNIDDLVRRALKEIE